MSTGMFILHSNYTPAGDQPEAIARRAETTFVQQPLQGVETTLNVADGVGGHGLPICPNS